MFVPASLPKNKILYPKISSLLKFSAAFCFSLIAPHSFEKAAVLLKAFIIT